MGKDRAIPQGYMTVGEVAKKMDVTVRTLQFYDREGLLTPSAESEGGRRLYTDKDLVQLHQILMLKHLGFSLDDIKNRLIPLDTPAEVADVLSDQAEAMRAKIAALTQSVQEIELLRAEVLQMQSVDFKRYADIIVNLQMKNDYYWLIKHFDDRTLDKIRNRFDKESSQAFLNTFSGLLEQAGSLQTDGVPPESEAGQALAKAFWDMVTSFTGGDMQMMANLMELVDDDLAGQDAPSIIVTFIKPALDAYFTALGVDPLEEEPE